MKLLSRNPPSHIRRAKKSQWKFTLCEDALFDLGYNAGEGEVRSLKGRLLAAVNWLFASGTHGTA
jgi:hypothetical protein